MSRVNQINRLSVGGVIDRDREIEFYFDGRSYIGYEGDTLASALLSNGVYLVGRSFKYHRPRGVLTAGSEEPNALVECRKGARREPNTRATSLEIFEGLEAFSQNCWPSLSFDVMSVNRFFSSFFVAGFYYKTFMWPPRLWERVYEPIIRRAAGLGKGAVESDPDVYERKNRHCDVLVVGGGISGLSAALSAGRSGARVILCEKDFELGGRLLSDKLPLSGMESMDLVKQLESEISELENVLVMKRTLIFGVYDGNVYGGVERVCDHLLSIPEGYPRQVLWRIVASNCIVASGGIERPVVMGNNDLPGVMLAGAVRTYMSRYGVAVGRKIVVVTNNDDAWKVLETAEENGIFIKAVVDSRNKELSNYHKGLLRSVGADFYRGIIGCVNGNKNGVLSVDVYQDDKLIKVSADCVAMSGGWDPALGLSCQHGGRPVWSDEKKAFLPPEKLPSGMTMVGVAAGNFLINECVETGHEAGVSASKLSGFKDGHGKKIRVGDDELCSQDMPFFARGKGGKAFVDFQHDVTLNDIGLAYREGYISVEHLKRYTTLGMATDQGKLSNVNGLIEMSLLRGQSISATGTTMFRSPYEPVAIGALSGRVRGESFRPYRLTPSHAWAEGLRAKFLESGLWLRAQWYVQGDETHWRESVDREVNAVRASLGICDVSTLGKIEVIGKDAPEFLNRVYANAFLKLPVGKARYGIMLREDGIVMDDGTTSRLGEGHFIMTTTTANAGVIMQHLDYCRQVLWNELEVQIFSVSDAWAQFSIAGPKSRELLTLIVDDNEDLSNEGFPFMAAREVTLKGGVKARLFRISFSGELAYEIALPSYYGDSFVRNVMRVGASLGITPYGTESLGVMRIEKGHVAGAELNGTTTMKDLGLGGMASNKKDYIGRVLATREGLSRDKRWRVVGLKPLDPNTEIHGGAHVFLKDVDVVVENDLGYITSACYSPTINSYISLALVRGGEELMGQRVAIYDPLRSQKAIDARICSPIFYDEKGGRQRA